MQYRKQNLSMSGNNCYFKFIKRNPFAANMEVNVPTNDTVIFCWPTSCILRATRHACLVICMNSFIALYSLWMIALHTFSNCCSDVIKLSRLYSDYNHMRHVSAEEFHQYVVKAIAEQDICCKNNSVRSCAYIQNDRINSVSCGYFTLL